MSVEACRVVDSLPDMVWTALADGSIDFVNQRWCEFTHLGVGESVGQGWQTAIHPGDLPELLERWRLIVASGKPGEMEVRLRRFDGEYRRFLFRARPLTNDSGELVQWCGINTDIEDRRQAEEALSPPWWLRASACEHHFRAVGDNITGLAVLVTPTGRFELGNRQILDFFGATPEELKRREITDLVHPYDLPKVLAAWREALETGRPYDVEERLRRADGVYLWFHTRGFPLRDTNGHVVLWYLIRADVDDAKRAETLLAGEKQLFELVASGHSTAEILEAICRLVEGMASGCYCSVVLVDSSGTRLEHGAAPSLPTSFINSIIGRPVNTDSGPCAMAATLNKQVIAADLMSGIITNASTCLRMLAANPPNIGGALETARRTIRDGNRASEVIARLRALFSKKDTATGSVDLNEATREVIALSLSDLQRHGVILRTELAEDLPPITGDRVQLQQVILNLVRNASHAMSTVDDRPREMLVRSERDVDDCVRLTVKDTGVGFDRDGVDRLFQAFYTTKNDGMGIGLSVSQSIIESHHGQLFGQN